MDDLELIERFLHGRLDQDETGMFLQRLHSDRKLKALFDSEAVLECRLYELALGHTTLPGIASDVEWNELAVPEAHGIGNCIPDDELRDMVAGAVATTTPQGRLMHFSRPAVIRCLMAASLLLAAGIATALLHPHLRRRNAPISVNRHQTVYEFDSVPVFSLRHSEGSSIAITGKKGIISIDTGTAAVAEQQTAITCNEFRDTAITLGMNAGTALFSVEKGKYRYFRVITPYATVTVTGTVFRVNIEPQCCFVSVENGSVDVRHSGKEITLPVHPGETVRADTDTLMQVWVERSIDELVARKKLLAGFLERHPPATRSDHTPYGTGGDLRVRNLRQDILEETPGVDSAVIALAHERPGDPDACRLLLDLARSHEGRRMWRKAADILEKVERCDTSAASPFRETARYRRGRLLLQTGDTAAAIAVFRQFMTDFPESAWFPDITAVFLSTLQHHGDLISADSLLLEIVDKRNRSLPDRMLMEHADALRENGQFNRALFWYEYLVTENASGKYRDDARYWAGWCVVQQSIEKREKRAFNHD